jgi:hypothetical protein
MKNLIKSSVLAALLVASVQASAKTAIFDLDFIATNNYGTTANSVGTVTMTDLSDLNLGDGASGVRVTVALNNLSQFSSGNTGAVWISSYEMNFAGTELLGNDNFRHVAGLNTNRIEWEEDGCLGYGSSCAASGGGWGGVEFDPAWGQEVNFATSTFTNGQFSTIDYLNGGNAGYTGFSVDQLLANAVQHSSDPTAPDAYFWIRIRGNTAANGGGMASSGYWGDSFTNGSGTGLNYRLNVLATSATVVPEAETFAMMMAGLGLMGAIVRRRRSA